MSPLSDLAYFPFIKSGRMPEVIGYEMLPCAAPQARFRNRLVARPSIDLKDYRCRAVIDWLEVEVSLGRPTQFQYVQRLVAEHTHRSEFVRAISAGPGGAASSFTIKVQDPSLAEMDSIVGHLEEEFGLATPCIVSGIEVSVDLYSVTSSSSARSQMVGLLARHLFPARDFITNPMDRPRFKWGRGRKHTRFIVGARNRTVPLHELSRWPDNDMKVPADATLYIGERDGLAQWKVMEKLLDQQHPTGKVSVLEEEERRARVEVTLNRDELLSNGIDTMADLRSFSFARFQGRYFRFMLPTFETRFTEPLVAPLLEQNRKKRFYNGGVVGLVMLDRSMDALRKFHRPTIARHLQDWGCRAVARSRVGSGISGKMVGYKELNDIVSHALESLGRREAKRDRAV